MKVLYVSCIPDSADDILVDLEITQLQQCFLGAQGEPVQFLALPKLSIEQFPLALTRHRPNILHISAHGDKDELVLAQSSGGQVALTGKLLSRFLNYNSPPRLVYLNACNSGKIASVLSNLVAMSIGTTAPISNRAALSSALLFYDRLLTGDSVLKAYDAGCAMIETLQDKAAKSVLRHRNDIDPADEILHSVPEIIARFVDDNCEPDDDDDFKIEVGLFGCPNSTVQVVVFTDDATFLPDDDIEDDDEIERARATRMCRVIRSQPVRQILWCEGREFIFGNYRLFAAGVTANGDVFSVASVLIDALFAYYRRFCANKEIIQGDCFNNAIRMLRANDGSGLAEDSSVEKENTKTKKRLLKKTPAPKKGHLKS